MRQLFTLVSVSTILISSLAMGCEIQTHQTPQNSESSPPPQAPTDRPYFSSDAFTGFLSTQWKQYDSDVQDKIFAQCESEKLNAQYPPIAVLSIQRDGKLTSQRTIRSSGNAELDQNFSKMISGLSPFKPFDSNWNRPAADFVVWGCFKNKDDKKTAQESKIDLVSYIGDVQTRIDEKWHVSDEQKNPGITIVLIINRQGQLVFHNITKSKATAQEEAVLEKAIKDAAPFPALPQDYENETVVAEFTFGSAD